MSRPTMNDVAEAAGVSRATVSRALSGHPSVSAELRASIEQSARDLGYARNPLVSALMSQRRGRGPEGEIGTLAYLQSHSEKELRGGIYERYRQGALERAKEQGYLIECFPLGPEGLTPERLRTILRTRGIRGLCLGPMRRPHARLRMNLDGFAVAAIGVSLAFPRLHRASIDHPGNAALALRRLRHAGHTRIGVCLEEVTSGRGNDGWLSAFFIERHHHPERQYPLLMTPRVDGARLQSWIESEKPEVILCDTDLWPKSLAGLKGKRAVLPPFVYLNLPPGVENAIGINQNAERVGAAAIDHVIAQLHRNESGIPAHPKTTLIEGKYSDGSGCI
ncbi:MAG: LacI family DNA-binding transcriptional regulator [Opitutales bacterium]